MLDKIFPDGTEAGSYGDVVLQQNVKTVMTKKVTDKKALKRVGKGRTLTKRIRKKQLEFLGLIMRKEKMLL